MMSVLHSARGWATVFRKASAIAALFVASQIPCAEATTYYVSSSQGNDTNSGTNPAAAWLTVSNIYNHSYGGRSFRPGDSILFRAGDSFDGPVVVNQGGTNGVPITLDRYGSGANPIIYGDTPHAVWQAVAGYTGLYAADLGCLLPVAPIDRVYDTNGLVYYHLLQGTNTLANYLSTFTNTCWGSSGNYAYVMTRNSNAPAQLHLFRTSVVLLSGGYHIIQNLQIGNGGAGISVDGQSNIVRNNLIHDGTKSGIMVYDGVGTQVVSNTILNNGYTMIYLVGGGNNWVSYNTGITNGRTICGNVVLPAGWDTSGVGLDASTNNLVEHNYFAHMNQAFFDYYFEEGSEVRYNYGFHASCGASPSGTGLLFHHNILDLDGAGSGLSVSYAYDSTQSPGPATGTNLIYNNVIYNFTGYGCYGTSNSSAGVCLRNNIFVTPSTTTIMASMGQGVDLNYNLYFCSGGTPKQWTWNSAREATFGVFQAASGKEANGIYANPQFVSASPTNAADFQVKSNSPCVDAGQNLKLAGWLAPAAPYQDYLGTKIPQGAGPDIGTYEMISLNPPTGVHLDNLH